MPTVKNVFRADTTLEIVSFTVLHAALTLFLKSSLVIYRVTRAVPTAAIRVASALVAAIQAIRCIKRSLVYMCINHFWIDPGCGAGVHDGHSLTSFL